MTDARRDNACLAPLQEAIWTVTLKRGAYTFLCDPHASAMRGTFRVNLTLATEVA